MDSEEFAFEKPKDAKNVFGEPLQQCGVDPVTGIFRDGYCHTCEIDTPAHIVCIIASLEFLMYSKDVLDNDLMALVPEFEFYGLRPGDRWCLNVLTWLEAFKAGKAPKVILEATHEDALDYVSLDVLKQYAA